MSNSGNGGEGGEPSGSQELGGPPLVTQSPTAGGAGGVVTDGEVRACQAPVTPVVPHLPSPDPVCNARGDLSNSPLHPALRFNHFTPNPSAPSQLSASPSTPPSLHVHGGASACAAVVFCIVCGDECGPEVETSYGKCQRCLDSAFHAFSRTHCPSLVAQWNSSPSLEGAAALAAGAPSGKDARADAAAAVACAQDIPFINSSPSIEGTAASAVHFASSPAIALGGPLSAKRARRLSPPHRKAGPPN